MQRAHAIANGVYVAAVNRVGLEKPPAGTAAQGIEFWGGTFVADPFGVVLAEASRTDEETLIVTCDRRHQETVRQHWPFLRDRRIDAYGAIDAPVHRRMTRGKRGTDGETPAELGFRMPAEWEPHAATWLAWPHEPRDWPGKLAPIPWVYGEVVRHLARGERVRILVNDAGDRDARRARCSGAWASTWGRSTSSACRPTAAGRATICPLFVKTTERRRRHHQLALQRLGEVPQPQEGRRHQRPARKRLSCGSGSRRSAVGGQAVARRARGRQHRRQRRAARCSRPRSAC